MLTINILWWICYNLSCVGSVYYPVKLSLPTYLQGRLTRQLSVQHSHTSNLFSFITSILEYFLLGNTLAICNYWVVLMKSCTRIPVPTQRLACISSLRPNSSLCSVWVQMEKLNLIGCRKWPFCPQQTNCQALHMKKGLKMQLADVHVMSAMWVSGEWDPWITEKHKNTYCMAKCPRTYVHIRNTPHYLAWQRLKPVFEIYIMWNKCCELFNHVNGIFRGVCMLNWTFFDMNGSYFPCMAINNNNQSAQISPNSTLIE